MPRPAPTGCDSGSIHRGSCTSSARRRNWRKSPSPLAKPRWRAIWLNGRSRPSPAKDRRSNGCWPNWIAQGFPARGKRNESTERAIRRSVGKANSFPRPPTKPRTSARSSSRRTDRWMGPGSGSSCRRLPIRPARPAGCWRCWPISSLARFPATAWSGIRLFPGWTGPTGNSWNAVDGWTSRSEAGRSASKGTAAVLRPIRAGKAVRVPRPLVFVVHALYKMPEAQRVDFFFPRDLQRGPFQHGVERQIRTPAEMLGQRGDDSLDRGNELVAVAEVIQHHDPSTWPANADHFADDTAIIRHGGHDVRGDHRIETVVREFHRAGVHPIEPHMAQSVGRGPFFRFFQHAFREIDAHDLAMAGVHRERQPGAHPDLQDSLIGLHIEIADRGFPSLVKHLPEHMVIDIGISRIDTLDFLKVHVASTPHTRLPADARSAEVTADGFTDVRETN